MHHGRLVPLLLAAASVALLLVAPLAAARARVDVSGRYQSNWDEVQLRQRGTRVTGSYVCCGGGTIEGTIIEDRTESILRYRWKQPGAEGAGAWTIGDGRLDGTWGTGVSERDGGRWDLVRDQPQIAQ